MPHKDPEKRREANRKASATWREKNRAMSRSQSSQFRAENPNYHREYVAANALKVCIQRTLYEAQKQLERSEQALADFLGES